MPSTAMVHDYADGAGYTRWKMLCVAGRKSEIGKLGNILQVGTRETGTGIHFIEYAGKGYKHKMPNC